MKKNELVRGVIGEVLREALAVGGQVATVVGVAFSKLTLRIGQPSAQQVIRVVAFPVVGHAAANIRVVADMVIDEMHVGLAGSLHRPRPAGKG